MAVLTYGPLPYRAQVHESTSPAGHIRYWASCKCGWETGSDSFYGEQGIMHVKEAHDWFHERTKAWWLG